MDGLVFLAAVLTLAGGVYVALLAFDRRALTRDRLLQPRQPKPTSDELVARRAAWRELQAIEYAAGLPVPPPVVGAVREDSSRGWLMIPGPVPDEPGDDFTEQLVAAMTRTIENPGAASCTAPMIVRGPAQLVQRPTPPPSRPDPGARGRH